MPRLPVLTRAPAVMTAALAALLGAAAQAAPIPDAIEAMIRAASPAELGAVEAVAKRAAPDSEAEIAALARSIRDARKAGEAERIAAQGFFDGWSGEGALGGSMSSGNTDEFGVSASLGLDKRTTRWEHDLRLSFDYLETNGAVQRERVYAGYTGRFDLSGDAFFSFGLLSFERDRFSGIDYRLTGSLGLGYRLVQNDDFSWTVEGGPAFRQTGFTDGVETGRLDLLGRTDLEWKPSSTLTLTQAAGGLLSGGNSSLFSKSAATAKLGGTLSARLSVDVLYESEPPAGRDTTDIISRASIVYGF